MTPKEKAKELLDEFQAPVYISDAVHSIMFGDVGVALTETQSKKYALIAVDKIIEAINNLQYERKTDFWENVKTEIEKL
jgi:hypothetical protein